MLTPDQVAHYTPSWSRSPTESPDYTDKKKAHNDIQWTGGAITELIANPPMIAWLERLFGDLPVLMTYDYARSEAGCPAINLHADGQPWGSKIFGAEQSCPRLVRVLYYLQDLTPERAPFRVVPRSHLSFHNQRQSLPALPRASGRGDGDLLGRCCLFDQPERLHGNFPNRSGQAREMLGLAYRPPWSGPFEPVATWSEQQLSGVSRAVRAVMTDRNRRIWLPDAGNVHPDMPSEAEGIDPSRWELT